MSFVKTTGRTFNTEYINFAIVYDTVLTVQSAGYNQVSQISGPDYQTMLEALKGAGFVGEGTLINPRRVAAYEDAGSSARVYLHGADRVVHMPMDMMEAIAFPAPETIAPAVEVITTKPARKKKAK